jgi:hypothetical protein
VQVAKHALAQQPLIRDPVERDAARVAQLRRAGLALEPARQR